MTLYSSALDRYLLTCVPLTLLLGFSNNFNVPCKQKDKKVKKQKHGIRPLAVVAISDEEIDLLFG